MAYQPKSYRKFLAGTITAAVVASAVAPAASAAEVKFTDLAGVSAETLSAIEALVGLNVIVGFPDGTFKPNQPINNSQAAEMIVKFLPNVDPKAAPTGKVFEDLTEKSYASKFAEALVDAGLIPAGGKFNATAGITREAMAVVAVKAFGLTDTGKTVEIKDLDKASEAARASIKILAQHNLTNLLEGNFRPTETVTRSQFALFFYRGVQAVEAAKGETKAEVKVVDTNKVSVTFNKAVDTTKATVSLKKGLATQYTTAKWAEDKKSVVLEAPSAIPAGDYEVVVTGLEKEIKQAVKVEAVASKTVEISNVSFEKSATALVSFKVANQYNTDMKIAGAAVTASAYNVTQNTPVAVVTPDGTKSEFKLNLTDAKIDDEIRVIVTYNGLTVVKSAKVVAPGMFSEISLGNVELKANTTRITAGETGLKLPYVLKDQYGKDLKLTASKTGAAAIETADKVTFLSSDSTVIDPAKIKTDVNGNLTIDTEAKAGTVTITAVINASGKVATTVVKVEDVFAVKSAAVSAPTTLVAGGEKTTLDMVVTDQYGALVANSHAKVAALTYTSSSQTIVKDENIKLVNGKIEVTTEAAAKGTVTISVKSGTTEVGKVTFNVEEKAVPTAITGVTTPTLFEKDATKAITFADIKVKDQYGRDYTLKATDKVAVSHKDTTADNVTFAITGTSTDAALESTETLTFKGTENTVAEVINFKLVNNGASYDATLASVATKDITSYSIDAVGTVYAPAATASDAVKADYAVQLELVGKTAAGAEVVLVGGKVSNATSTDASVASVSATGLVSGKAKGSSTVALWSGSTKLAETTVTVSDATPVATKVAFTTGLTSTVANGANLTAFVKITDQYGVQIPTAGFWTTSDEAVAKFTGGVVEKVAGGKVTVGFVTVNGLIVTKEVIVN
jgi:trimeric autotransporter adhesin